MPASPTISKLIAQTATVCPIATQKVGSASRTATSGTIAVIGGVLLGNHARPPEYLPEREQPDTEGNRVEHVLTTGPLASVGACHRRSGHRPPSGKHSNEYIGCVFSWQEFATGWEPRPS